MNKTRWIVAFWAVQLIVVSSLAAQDDISKYQRTVDAFSTFYLHEQPDSIYNLFSSAMKGALTPDAWDQTFGTLYRQLGRLGAFNVYKSAKYYTNFISFATSGSAGIILSIDSQYHIQGLFNAPPSLAKQSLSAINYWVQSNGVSLACTLTLPADSNHKMPVALIIPGSGSVDRDGNSPPQLEANTYRMLAEALKQRGIATLRYNKRYLGESRSIRPKDSLTIADMIEDAIACIRLLKADSRFSSVTVIGHSEGALVGLIACLDEKPDKYISIAGAGETAGDLLKRQLSAAFPDAADTLSVLLDSLAAGYRVVSPIKEGSLWSTFFSPSIQSYLISWFQYDPTLEIKRLKIPALLIQGGTDLQVSLRDVHKLKAALPSALLVILPDMNHILKDAPADRQANLDTYFDKDRPLDPQLVDTVVGFIMNTASP